MHTSRAWPQVGDVGRRVVRRAVQIWHRDNTAKSGGIGRMIRSGWWVWRIGEEQLGSDSHGYSKSSAKKWALARAHLSAPGPLRLVIDQVLSPDSACQDAVGRRLSQRIGDGQSACSLSSGPYCKARQGLALGVPQRLCKQLGQQLEHAGAPRWGWRGRSVKTFDATTVSMPDTPHNQGAWLHRSRQQPGWHCAFCPSAQAASSLAPRNDGPNRCRF